MLQREISPLLVLPKPEISRERAMSLAGVAALHVVIGYAFITGLGFEFAADVGERLKLVNVMPVAPPKPEERPPVTRPEQAEEGASAPPNIKSRATEVVAPQPKVQLDVPTPIVAAPAAATGSDSSSGAAEVAGPGTGAGGEGDGTGSGRSGDGTGSGGVASRAKWIGGRIVDRDYPRRARRAGVEGIVYVRFSVEPDGKVGTCRVEKSSGNVELDETTCRLIRNRYRYEPARDAAGKPVTDMLGWKQIWWIEYRDDPRTPPVDLEAPVQNAAASY